MSRALLIHEDTSVLAVNKPHGMLTHNSAYAGPREESLIQVMGGGLHAVHRLDRATSGVVLLARSAEAAKQWQAALSSENTRKIYLALVRGRLEGVIEVDHPIRDEEGHAHPARSTVRGLAVSPVERCSLAEIELHTGRHHQARRHLKHLSHPVLGDTTYGHGSDNRAFRDRVGLRRLALHARSLTITHPLDGTERTFTAPVPDDLRIPLEKLFPVMPARVHPAR